MTPTPHNGKEAGFELFMEHAEHGCVTSEEQWFRQQLNFLNQHQYRTISAQALRGPQKQHNQRELLGILQQLAPSSL